MKILWLMAGGAVGTLLRYAVNTGAARWLGNFPISTLLVNAIGSFMLGFLAFSFVNRWQPSEEIRLALMVGLLGAFTTFSAFALDTLTLHQQGETAKAILNVLLNVACSLLAVWLGASLAR